MGETPLKSAPTVYNIAAGQSFADALAQGILESAVENPLKLSECTILLPSRRACRTLREAFLRLSGGKAVLLPALRPIGDVDADEVALFLAGGDDIAESIDIPPAVSRLERQLLLAQTIQKAEKEMSFDQAAALALGLGHFLDEVQTERLGFDGLAGLVPEEFAGHWRKTIEFLKILTEHWPAILAERGVIDFAERRNLLLEAQARAWKKNPPQGQVVAAGSTGTVPAAAELLSLVARLPQGMLVLPGLDTGMDAESWDALSGDHPQYNMKKLLLTVGIKRGDVQDWPLRKKPVVNSHRVRLMSEAMRPADTAEKWRKLKAGALSGEALDGFTRIDCDTPSAEADVIALSMRETLETPGKTCALITPDRRLARRVSLSLRRWGIAVDDSGGQPLTELPVGAWLMLTAEMAEEDLAPVTLLSFLKHPFLAEDLRCGVSALDELALRGPRPSGGFQGLRDAAAAADCKSLPGWLDKIEARMKDFVQMMSSPGEKPFHEILTRHIRMAEDLAAAAGVPGPVRLWQGDAGEAASEFLGNLLRSSRDVPPLSPEHYISLLGTLLKTVTVRPSFGSHPRLSILGQIEARLYCADRVILGGLNEGTWPGLPAHDPWMSRPMRKRFGLPSPERSIGLAAHDFAQAGTAAEVIVTRSKKTDGAPTVPARWLLRLETVLKAAGLDWPETQAQKYRQWAKDMDRPPEIRPVSRPSPTPPVEARPRKLSVTKIENWMRDPYQIYAKYVLGLDALDPLDADPGGAERGTFIHAALERFIKEFPDDLPDDAEARLLAFGRNALTEMRIPQEVVAFWWPRFEKIAGLFIRQERDWREKASPYLTEIDGRWHFEAPGGSFTLTGKADRIDRLRDGSYAIIDYKSGVAPEPREVKAGLSPQLPLEAVILEKGGFEKISGKVSELIYWKVTGSGQNPVEKKSAVPKDASADQIIADAEAGLKALVARFDDASTPYLSRPRHDAKPRFSDYEHLARTKEWSVAGDDGEEAA
ncbi:MAG: double-strand break repair protein AddB [Pseudomonadota bacterium]